MQNLITLIRGLGEPITNVAEVELKKIELLLSHPLQFKLLYVIELFFCSLGIYLIPCFYQT